MLRLQSERRDDLRGLGSSEIATRSRTGCPLSHATAVASVRPRAREPYRSLRSLRAGWLKFIFLPFPNAERSIGDAFPASRCVSVWGRTGW